MKKGLCQSLLSLFFSPLVSYVCSVKVINYDFQQPMSLKLLPLLLQILLTFGNDSDMVL